MAWGGEKDGRKLLSVIVAVCGLAGCVSRPEASCASTGSYPLPATLCNSFAVEDVTSAVPPIAMEPAAKFTSSSESPRPVPSSERGVAGRMTISEVLRRLIRTNPDVGIAAAKEKEQYAAVDGAQAGMLPTLDLTAAAGPQRNWLSDPAGNAIRREIGLSFRQNLYDFGAAKSNYERASLAYQSATNARIAKTEQTAFDMLDLLLKVHQTDENIALAKRNIKAHEDILKIVQSNESDGNSTVADVKRVTTRLENAKTSLIDLTTERTNASDAFRRLTELDVDKVVDTVTPRLGGNPAELSQEKLDRNPDILAIQSEISSLREQLNSVEGSGRPNLGLESTFKAGRNMAEPDTSDRKTYANVLVSLRVPLLDGGANLSARRQVMARIEAAYLRLDKRRRELREEAQGAQRITSSDSDKSGSLVARVKAARKVQDLYFEQFKNGSRTVFELLDAQVDLVKAETDLISQNFSRRRSQIKALLLKGSLVQDMLALAPQ